MGDPAHYRGMARLVLVILACATIAETENLSHQGLAIKDGPNVVLKSSVTAQSFRQIPALNPKSKPQKQRCRMMEHGRVMNHDAIFTTFQRLRPNLVMDESVAGCWPLFLGRRLSALRGGEGATQGRRERKDNKKRKAKKKRYGGGVSMVGAKRGHVGEHRGEDESGVGDVSVDEYGELDSQAGNNSDDGPIVKRPRNEAAIQSKRVHKGERGVIFTANPTVPNW